MKPAILAGIVVAIVIVAGIGGYFLTRPPQQVVGAVTLNSPTGTTDNSSTLTWSQSTDEDFVSYAVYQSTSSGALGSQVTTITNKATISYTVTGLSPNTSYYFTIRVNRAGGVYRDSNQVSATTSGAPSGEGLALTPWSMFHNNCQHTGQSPFNGPQDNNLKWKYTRAEPGAPPGSFSVDNNGTVYVAAANKLLALSSDGGLLWSHDLAGTGATAISPNGATVYAAGGNNLYAFTTSGEAVWTYGESTESIHGEPCVASDGTIYFGSWDTYIYALNPDGTLKWKYQTDGAIAPLASPTLSTDEATVYVGSGDPNKDEGGTLYAIKAADGNLRWEKKLDQRRVSGAVVGPNGRIYVTGSGRVYCFSPDGTKVWESAPDTAASLTPSLSSDGTLYVGTARDGKVYAINSSNGQTKWSYQTGINPYYDPANPHAPQYGVLGTPVIGANGNIYVGAIDGVMYAFKPDGSVLWTYQTGDAISESCPAIGPDGTLYFGSADKYIYAIKG